MLAARPATEIGTNDEKFRILIAGPIEDEIGVGPPVTETQQVEGADIEPLAIDALQERLRRGAAPPFPFP